MSWLDALFSNYKTIAIAGVALPQRNTLNFPANAVGVDNPSLNRTDVTPSPGSLPAVTGTGVLTVSTGTFNTAASLGAADTVLSTNHAANNFAWIAPGPDVTLASGVWTVVAIQSKAVPAPTGIGTVLTWNAGSSGAFSWGSGGGGGSFTPGSDLLGNSTSTATNQYVSGLSYSSAAAGGPIAVNGTNTLLNWASNAITLQQGGTTLVQLKATGSDFVSFGASGSSVSASGFIRAPNATTISTARNHLAASDIVVTSTDSSDNVILGGGAVAGVKLVNGSGTAAQLAAAATDFIRFGNGAVPTLGFLRFHANDDHLTAMNNAGTNPILIISTTSADNVVIGGLFSNGVILSGAPGGTGTTYLQATGASTDYLQLGATGASVAASGLFRVPNGQNIVNARNQANIGDILVLGTDSSNNVSIASAGANSIVFGNALVQWLAGTIAPTIQLQTQGSDTATQAVFLQGQSAFASATTNQNGSSVVVQGGNAKTNGTAGLRGGVILGIGQGTIGLVQTAEVVLGNRIVAINVGGSVTSTQMPANTGDLVAYMHNASTTPTANATSGGIDYATLGSRVWRGSSGTTTTMAPA